MFQTIARDERETRMSESSRRNGSEHVPPCSIWPPPWLKAEAEAAKDAEGKAEPGPDVYGRGYPAKWDDPISTKPAMPEKGDAWLKSLNEQNGPYRGERR